MVSGAGNGHGVDGSREAGIDCAVAVRAGRTPNIELWVTRRLPSGER
ncbi:hypothetical protein MT49_3153 [Mycobacterium tuberculosis 49-02]|nr:hypothetical protein HX91_2014 [Mycobacterium tuberculosis]CDM11287.1 hypothetical protein MT49_3153 [Mycobacterium tuberculosis 49-02]